MEALFLKGTNDGVFHLFTGEYTGFPVTSWNYQFQKNFTTWIEIHVSAYHYNAESNSHVNLFFICTESTGIGAYIQSNTSIEQLDKFPNIY